MEMRSDVYSFGCVILEILMSERPWINLNNDVATIMNKVMLMKEQHNLSKVRVDAPPEFIDLIHICLLFPRNQVHHCCRNVWSSVSCLFSLQLQIPMTRRMMS